MISGEMLMIFCETLTILPFHIKLSYVADGPATPMAGPSFILYSPPFFTHSSLHDEFQNIRFLPMTITQLFLQINDTLVKMGDNPDQLLNLLLGPAELLLNVLHAISSFLKGGVS